MEIVWKGFYTTLTCFDSELAAVSIENGGKKAIRCVDIFVPVIPRYQSSIIYAFSLYNLCQHFS